MRAPEHLALAAAGLHGPAAARWVARERAAGTTDPNRLAALAKRRHARLARVGGAATGLGGFVTIVPDLVALAWIQSRMVFFLAGALGYDPTDRMRPAELLVLQGIHPDPWSARETLDGIGPTLASSYIGNRTSGDGELSRRLLAMVTREAAERLGGRVIPGVAVVFNAVANERDTRALADRAIAFYAGEPRGG